jgi:hypothetical protein
MRRMRKSEKSSADDVYHSLNAKGSHDMKEIFGVAVYWEAHDSSQDLRWTRPSMRSSVLCSEVHADEDRERL